MIDRFELVIWKMVRLGGFEPPTSGATILRSNQLSYNRTSCQRPYGQIKLFSRALLTILPGFTAHPTCQPYPGKEKTGGGPGLFAWDRREEEGGADPCSNERRAYSLASRQLQRDPSPQAEISPGISAAISQSFFANSRTCHSRSSTAANCACL